MERSKRVLTRLDFRQALVWSLSSILLAICIYRVWTFVPQPLDSPGTLRPLLYAGFTAFAGYFRTPEQAQQAWRICGFATLVIPAVLAFLNYFSAAPRLLRGHGVFFASVAGCLLLCRFPVLLTGQINPDETLFLAAAEKLFRDPVYFRAVDCGTTGPLNILPLMTPVLFGISPDYASARLIALMIIVTSVYVIFRALALLAGEAVAYLAVLPAAGVFACLKQIDFLHYSSEHVSFLLLSLALYLCVKVLLNPVSHAWELTGLGLLTAASFFAKMQTVPIIGCLAVVALAYVHWTGHAGRFFRPALLFVAGLAPLPVLNAIICAAAGVWPDFWMEYLVANYRYVQAPGSVTPGFRRFAEWVFLQGAEIRFLIAVVAAEAALFLAMALLYRTSAGRSSAALRWFGFLTAALVAVAAATVYTPNRPYAHYLLLLVLPLTLAMAWLVVAGSRFSAAFPIVFAILNLAWQLVLWHAPDSLRFAEVPSTVRPATTEIIDSLVRPEDRITVWGWDSRLYLGAGRVSANKDLVVLNLFVADPEVRAYYRTAYIRGLQQRPPELFVDALATSWGTFADSKEHGFEQIPEIFSIIRSNYIHVRDAYGQRFYLRRGRTSM